jgi:hypothetical protein
MRSVRNSRPYVHYELFTSKGEAPQLWRLGRVVP